MDEVLAQRHNQELLKTLLSKDNPLPPMESRVAAQRLLTASRRNEVEIKRDQLPQIEALARE